MSASMLAFGIGLLLGGGSVLIIAIALYERKRT